MPLLAAAEMDIGHIDILSPSNNASTADLVRGLQYALQHADLGVDTTIQNTESYQNNNPTTTLVIAVGDGTLPWLNDKRNSFAAAIAFHVNSTAFSHQNKSAKNMTALYRDQPLSRQLRLAKLLLPDLKRAAVLRSAGESILINRELQRELNVTVSEVTVGSHPDWLKLLSLSLRDNDVLLGVDDPAIYNSETLRSILLTSYRHGKGLVGPSRAFVNAGSLASCYTSTDQYLQQVVDMVSTIVRQHRLPDPQFPKNFRVTVNQQVATSLNISIPDETTLSAWPQKYYGECSNGC